jgi:hypothetical protein
MFVAGKSEDPPLLCVGTVGCPISRAFFARVKPALSLPKGGDFRQSEAEGLSSERSSRFF